MKIEIVGTVQDAQMQRRDHRIVRVDGKFVGFIGLDARDCSIRLQKCPKCDRSNYAMAVTSGICSWCGFDVNKAERESENAERIVVNDGD